MELNWEKYDLVKANAVGDKYAQLIVERMRANLQQNDLADTMNLINSIKAKVVTKNLEVERIQFSYEFYGLIWEKGASNVFGKGVTLNPRSWRDKAIEAIRPELEKDFGELYAEMIINELVIESAQLSM